jgi:hypothetical protein
MKESTLSLVQHAVKKERKLNLVQVRWNYEKNDGQRGDSML